MNDRAFTNESLTMMCEVVRGALEGQGEEPKFKIRDTPERTQPTSRLKCLDEECRST